MSFKILKAINHFVSQVYTLCSIHNPTLVNEPIVHNIIAFGLTILIMKKKVVAEINQEHLYIIGCAKKKHSRGAFLYWLICLNNIFTINLLSITINV